MSQLEIRTTDGRTWWLPGSTLEGTARWRLEEDPKAVELRLIWFTSGKGTQDVTLVDRQRLDLPGLAGEQRFRFQLPEGPYSFAGTLISLAWALELVTEPPGESTRLDLVVAPTPVEVRLSPLDHD